MGKYGRSDFKSIAKKFIENLLGLQPKVSDFEGKLFGSVVKTAFYVSIRTLSGFQKDEQAQFELANSGEKINLQSEKKASVLFYEGN